MTQDSNTDLPAVRMEFLTYLDAWQGKVNRQTAASKAISIITDDATFQQAADAIQAFGKLARDVDSARKKITKPLDDAKKEVMAMMKERTAELEAERERLRKISGDYATEQARKREEALQAERERQAQAAMFQQEALAAFGISPEEATSVPEPEVAHVLVPDAPHSGAVRQVTVYSFEVTDESALARKFLSVDPAKIRTWLNAVKAQGIPAENIDEPGLKIIKEIRIDGK